jgi:hypothetical protein
VSDMGGPNRTLWNILGVSIDRPFYPNPFYEEKKFWIFADYPHLLKLLRNNMLDHRLNLADGTNISKQVFNDLIEVDSNELKICFKLTKKHINVVGFEILISKNKQEFLIYLWKP